MDPQVTAPTEISGYSLLFLPGPVVEDPRPTLTRLPGVPGSSQPVRRRGPSGHLLPKPGSSLRFHSNQGEIIDVHFKLGENN